MKNLILCGGVGSRLWPLRRNLMPKQFFPLVDGLSLFEMTVTRNNPLISDFIIAINSSQYFLVKDQLAGLNVDNYRGILEKVGRDTAPAITLTAMTLKPDDILLVTPSDQLILDVEEYHKAVKRAKKIAEDGYIVTFGIKASSPEVDFGYIKSEGDRVISFTEKPNLSKAQSYLESGDYCWNSGMFCFKVGVYLDEVKKLSPEIYETCKLALEGKLDNRELMLESNKLSQIPSISVDFAVMERSEIVKVVKADLNWSDIGSFDALYTQLAGQDSGNALLGSTDEIIINSHRNLIIAGSRKIACVDVDDLIIVDSEDALLISKRGSSQKVKDIVIELEKDTPYLLDAPMTVKRPWGSYTVLESPSHYKTKRIEVNPGKRLSLQYHLKREENWIFVQGRGKVRIGDKELEMSRGDYAFIPLETIHRVENIGDDKLIFIETQVGTYFGEDDIIRIEDDWGRT